MSLTAMLFLISYFGGICAAIFNPVAGIALYILVYHLNPQTQWWGASVQALGSRMSFTVALATAVGVLIRQPRLQYGAKQFPLTYGLAIVFGVIAIGSLLWGVDFTSRGQYQAEKYVKELIWLFIMIRCIRTPTHYQIVILSWMAGVLYMGYQAQGGVGLTVGGRLTEGLGGPDFDESSDLAVHLVATLPLVGAVFFMSRTWVGRTFALITGALAVNMLIMTRTRNAIAGLTLVMLACVLTLPRGYRVKGVAAVIAGAILSMHLTDPGWWNRMATIQNYQSDEAALGRLTYWQAAFDMVCDYPFGIGLGNFHHTVMDYVPNLKIIRGAHSTPMACLAELGWLGLFIFGIIVFVTLRRLGQTRRLAHTLDDHTEIRFGRWRSRFHLGWHATALRAGLLGYLGCGLFTTRLFSEDFWLLMGMAMCLHNVGKYIAGETELDRPLGVESLKLPEISPADSHTPVGVPHVPGQA